MASFSAAEILTRSRSAPSCAISLWIATVHSNRRSHCSALQYRCGCRSISIRAYAGAVPACASFQHARYEAHHRSGGVSLTAILHYASPADHLEIGDFANWLKVVLHPSKMRFCSLRSSNGNGDSGCYRLRTNLLFEAIQPAAAAKTTRHATSTALVGLRCSHFLPRARTPVWRA